jgi:hypothetical protein
MKWFAYESLYRGDIIATYGPTFVAAPGIGRIDDDAGRVLEGGHDPQAAPCMACHWSIGVASTAGIEWGRDPE